MAVLASDFKIPGLGLGAEEIASGRGREMGKDF